MWYSDCGYGISPFPPSGNEGYIRNRDVPLQSVTTSHNGDWWNGFSTKAPQELPPPMPPPVPCVRPPGPSYKADNRTGFYTEKVDYCSLSNPNSRTWITLGKHALPPGRDTLRSHLLPEGVTWHSLMWSNPVGPYCTWKYLRWLRLHHLETAELGLQGNTALVSVPMEITYGIPTGSLIKALASHQISRINWLKGLALDAPPFPAAGVLEDSTGLAL